MSNFSIYIFLQSQYKKVKTCSLFVSIFVIVCNRMHFFNPLSTGVRLFLEMNLCDVLRFANSAVDIEFSPRDLLDFKICKTRFLGKKDPKRSGKALFFWVEKLQNFKNFGSLRCNRSTKRSKHALSSFAKFGSCLHFGLILNQCQLT